ncbi:hypothetical protein BDB00DRAFT_162213 [Zychaea mexicana]|uniref:uncharacterized protein n=1 Tax=Zychaea mexicana TaxID=64656 RepID=UPI0022FE3431|nr:uncharacterized protein BDB00DRAFT_162213 [Zychaea mexicana]KAI9496080.1 hypothetical protein BDB00DRAFT_162213 [Zychaea mexicana]
MSARASIDESDQDGGVLTKTPSNDSDNQSVITNFSVSNYHSLNRVIAQLRGEKIKSENMNTEYWMPDSQCKECFDCNARFKFYRRKHHCRICGQIFCGKCASDIIQGERIGQSGQVRVCKFCYSKLQAQERQEEHDANTLEQKESNNVHPSIDPDSIVGLSPVLPGQKPPSAPKMQIPTTTLKAHQGEYGGQNSTTFALEIPTEELLPYALANSTAAANNINMSQPPPTPTIAATSTAAQQQQQQQQQDEPGMSLKGIFLATIRPRSRTNTMNSTTVEPTLANIDTAKAASIGSPIPFRRNSLNGQLNGFLVDGGGGTVLPSSEYDSEDESSRKWDKSPQNLLNFLGGGSSSDRIDDNNGALMSPTVPDDDIVVSQESSTKLRRRRAEDRLTRERSNSMRRRRSLTTTPSRSFRQRTHSLMRNTPITTMTPLSDTADDSQNLATPIVEDSNAGASGGCSGLNEALLLCSDDSGAAENQNSGSLAAMTNNNNELSMASMEHMRKMLRHLLHENESIIGPTHCEAWEDVLMKLLLQVSENVHPDIRGGDDMDLRHYIKIKKIAGGAPEDSYYVNGVVCSKNVAHKRMIRSIKNPQILILLFPLEWSRDFWGDCQLQSIDRVLAQERDFLEKLVNRIVALKPSVVLVSSNVSRIALEHLVKTDIVVAYNVKLSILDAVARCTGASIINSFLQLMTDGLTLGHCGVFETKTLVHDLIPHRRKTFLIFDKCPPELGATIIMRGGNVETLRVLKRIMDFMVFVVHNLRLESFLLMDLAKARITLHGPQTKEQQIAAAAAAVAITTEETPASSAQSVTSTDKSSETTIIADDNNDKVAATTSSTTTNTATGDDAEFLQAVQDAIHRYQNVTLSASSMVGLPAPHLLLRLSETQRKMIALIAARAPEALKNANHAPPNRLANMLAFFRSFDQIMMGDAEFERLLEEHHHRWRALEAYIGDNADTLSPSYHQQLVVLYMSVCSITAVPCQGPEMRMFEYYRPESDLTLGQYIEDISADANTPCPSNMCESTMLEHYRSYAHGNAKVNVDIERIQGPAPIMTTSNILMWSYCKHCDANSLLVPMSESSWKYSLGKFLELLFHQTAEAVCGQEETWCPHNLFRDHVHYFCIKGIAVRFQHEAIEPLEVHVPPMHLYINPKTQIALKDSALESTRSKITRFYESVIERDKNFLLDMVQPEEVDGCKEHLQEMSRRATGEKKQMLQALQSVYATTAPTDALSLNIVRIKLQMKVMQWDLEYAEFVRHYVRPERELRRHFKKMFPVESGITSGAVANLDVRTKRTAEAPDLPILDVGLDGPSDCTATTTAVNDIDILLKSQPNLGESPTSASPWLEEEARLDHILEEMIKEKLSRKQSGDTANSLTAPSQQSGNSTAQDSAVDAAIADGLDPSVARRLSLELMKDTPKPLTSWTDEKEEQQQQQQQHKQQSKNEHQSHQRKRGSNNHGHNHTTTNTTTAAKQQVQQSHNVHTTQQRKYLDDYDIRAQKRRANNEQNRTSFPSGLTNHAAMLPLLSTAAYKRFTDILPYDSEIAKSQSSPPLMSKIKRKNYPKVDTTRTRATPATQQHSGSNGKERDRQDNNCSDISTEKRELALSGYRYGYKGSAERGSSASTHRLHPLRYYPRNHNNSSSNNNRGATDSSGSSSATSLHLQDSSSSSSVNRHQQQQQQSSSNSTSRLIHPSTRVDHLERNVKFATGRHRHHHLTPSGNRPPSSAAARGVRQRLPSKSSMEVYTTIRELVREESDDEFQASDSDTTDCEDEDDDDDDDNRDVDGADTTTSSSSNNNNNRKRQDDDDRYTSKLTFSLTHTDEYDESWGREMVPHQQLGQSAILHDSPVDTTVPHLTFDEYDNATAADGSASGAAATNDRPALHHHTISDFRAMNPAHGQPIPTKPNASMSNLEPSTLELSTSGSERNSFLKTITNMLAEKGLGNLLPLEYPLSPLEHVFPGSLIVVGEDEPSTIVAYTLSCDDYTNMLKEIRKGTHTDIPVVTDEQSMQNEHQQYNEKEPSAAGASAEPVTGMFIERTLRSKSGIHMKYYFTDGTTKFFCKIFFVEQFDALRRNCGCEESYIASLASCCKWDSSGGKSGSVFLKTKDDRLLIKQISRYEMDAFLRFAPSYFQYMSEAFFHELPTVLSKIFGLYRIGFKNSTTGKSMRMDILVMENLFYERAVKKIFDLKGSMRNRHVQATGRENEVLLDENMVELMFQAPLFLRSHSKEMLRGSLHNDTLFLSRLDVMDYSLLVGVDEDNRELIVGIVDFIRTFTWDKKLESWVKESGILGGGGKEPTIISPKQYRIRFREAMDRYFLMVPDFWTAKLVRRQYHHEDHHTTNMTSITETNKLK